MAGPVGRGNGAACLARVAGQFRGEFAAPPLPRFGLRDDKGGMAVRRIHFAMLALGLVGVMGFTIVQGAAEPAKSPYGGRQGGGSVVVPTEFAAPKIGEKDTTPTLPSAPMPDIVMPPLPPMPSIDLPSKPNLKPVPTKSTKDATAAPLILPPPTKPGLPDAPEIEMKPVVMPPKPKHEPAHTEVKPPIITAPAFPGGSQSNRVAPSVTIETSVPDAVPLGKDINYEIVVRNTGLIPVSGVRVEEEMPTRRPLSGRRADGRSVLEHSAVERWRSGRRRGEAFEAQREAGR